MTRTALLLVVLAVLAVATPATAAGRPPNVLVVMTDDQVPAQMIALPRTRELLGKEGTTYTQALVEDALCCPSRSTFMSGQNARNHGVLNNAIGQGGGYPAFDFSNAIGVWLQKAGYFTAHVGKQLNGYGTDARALPVPAPGYSDWFATIDPTTYSSYNYAVSDNGVPRAFGSLPSDYQTDVLADRVEQIIRSQAGRPWFVHFAPQPPHWEIDLTKVPFGTKPPLPAPRHAGAFGDLELPGGPAYDEADVSDKPKLIRDRPRITAERKAEILRFYRQGTAGLLAVDEAVERFVTTLRETGQLDDTIILFVSDNGFYNGEHRLPNSKSIPYEQGLRVPMIIRGPGFAKNATVTAPVSNVDLAPTIVRATGATAERVMDGRPLQDPASPDRATFHEAKLSPDTLVAEGGSKLDLTVVRTRRWKLIHHKDTGERELYDLLADPHELQSLHDAPRQTPIRDVLARELLALESCTGAACVRDVVPPRPSCIPGRLRLGGGGARGVALGSEATTALVRIGSPRAVGSDRWTWCRAGGGQLRAWVVGGRVRAILGTGRSLTSGTLATGLSLSSVRRRYPSMRVSGTLVRLRPRGRTYAVLRRNRVRAILAVDRGIAPKAARHALLG